MAEDIKDRVKEVYRETSATYDDVRFVRICAERILELAALQDGESVLDVATGTGHLAIAASQTVGANGSVVGLDLTDEMLEQARAKSVRLNLPNIEWREGDAEQLPFKDSTFDVVLCGSGIFFLPNQLHAMNEWRRCLKPGGRVLFSSFGEGNNASLAGVIQKWHKEYGLEGMGVPFPLPQPEQCRSLLADAGFVDVEVLAERHDYRFTDAEEFWQEYWGTQSKAEAAKLSPERLAGLREGLLGDVSALATASGIERRLPLNFAMGRKPS